MIYRKLKDLIIKPYIKIQTFNQNVYRTKNSNEQFNLFNSFVFTSNDTNISRMSSVQKLRFRFKDWNVRRLWDFWSRGFLLSSMVKRVKRDRGVIQVIKCFKQTILRPRRTLFLAAAAAYNKSDDDVPPCENSISDEDMEALKSDLDRVDELSANTLFCPGCGKRLAVDKKKPGTWNCPCGDVQNHSIKSYEGWSPYIEADDVIIWRREHNNGTGLYEYKVYGRYPEVSAVDLAAIQVDGVYRKVWDSAVASLAVVETAANGVKDQFILHWEVLWPKLFANRDYVYVRRHKDYDVQNKPMPHKDILFLSEDTSKQEDNITPQEKESDNTTSDTQVSSEDVQIPDQGSDPASEEVNGKKADNEEVITELVIDTKPNPGGESRDNKTYIIVSRSCKHPMVPETRRAIRVTNYWSHMVVRSLNGVNKPGAEFVLTYFDSPSTGALPGGVVAWASGRAAPAYLHKMREAAVDYKRYLSEHPNDQELPAFLPAEKLAYRAEGAVKEEDMESSQSGPDLDHPEEELKDNNSRIGADPSVRKGETVTPHGQATDGKEDKTDRRQDKNVEEQSPPPFKDMDAEEQESTNTWWRYFYPFYYFI